MSGMSKGEYRVGISFNPSGTKAVKDIKAAAAFFIDMIEVIDDGSRFPLEQPVWDTPRGDRTAEIRRLKALAQTAIEAGAMWAVKAATKREPEGES